MMCVHKSSPCKQSLTSSILSNGGTSPSYITEKEEYVELFPGSLVEEFTAKAFALTFPETG
jgi:hypothetical protein